eukprot:gene21171-23246_t
MCLKARNAFSWPSKTKPTSEFGQASCEKVISGKHYNNSMRVLKYVYDALQRLEIAAFEKWLTEKGGDCTVTDMWTSSELAATIKETTPTTFNELMSNHNPVFELMAAFESSFSETHAGPLAMFWLSFLQMMRTLLAFIRSVRQGDWNLHLLATQRMLPWMFAYDGPNYSRFLTLYWAEMQKLPQTHPEVYNEFW